jgi:streptogramin lyase
MVLAIITIAFGTIFLILNYGGIVTEKKVSSLVMPVEIEYDSPLERPTGLAWDGRNLWLASANEHKICSINPPDGRILETLEVEIRSPWGLAWDNGCLWVVDFYTSKIHQVDIAEREIISSINTPGSSPTGLTWDGSYLWLGDFNEHRIFKLDPLTGLVQDSIKIPSPGYNPSGLSWREGKLWVSDLSSSYIMEVDPESGEMENYYYSSGYYPSDSAWDEENFWVLDYSKHTISKTNPGEQAFRQVNIGVPSWFGLAYILTIAPVIMSILSIVKQPKRRLPSEEKKQGTSLISMVSRIALVSAILGSVYTSYELLRLIYSVVFLNTIIFKGQGPLLLYRFEMFVCAYTLIYWLYYSGRKSIEFFREMD